MKAPYYWRDRPWDYLAKTWGKGPGAWYVYQTRPGWLNTQAQIVAARIRKTIRLKIKT